MSLITCPECGRDVSDKAIACPGCGVPVQDVLRTDGLLPTVEFDEAMCSWEEWKERSEKRFLQMRLELCGGNVKQAAESLRMQRSNLYKKIEKHGLELRRPE